MTKINVMSDLPVLIQKCIERDLPSWDTFYREYYGYALKSIRYKLRRSGVNLSSADEHDIAQEVFHDIWESDKLTSLKDPSHLRTWLAMLAVNHTRNFLRKHFFLKEKFDISMFTPVSPESDIQLFQLFESPRDTIKDVEFRELHSIVSAQINTLPKKQKIAAKLNILSGRKYKDVAGIMGLPLATVSTLLSRAKRSIKASLSDRYSITSHG